MSRPRRATPPQWALEAFGPVPADAEAREKWTARAATVAAHRELTGHDDPATALGAAPQAGQVEAYASWRAAWRALGRPDADRDELELSDGQLRIRVRAYEREQNWAPRYVANELAGTTAAAATHRQTAALRLAEADTADGPDRDRLTQEAADATALADLLDAQAEQLTEADHARGLWYAHTAATRTAATRARAELFARHAEHATEEPLVTAEQWLAEHRAADLAEDPHREITDEADLSDVATQHAHDLTAHDLTALDREETDRRRNAPTVPELSGTEVAPDAIDEDLVRVPTASEVADSLARARAALAEIDRRRALDETRTAEEARAGQLSRWHAADHATADERNLGASHERGRGRD